MLSASSHVHDGIVLWIEGDRADNGVEFAGRTMQDSAARRGVELRFIQPGKPVQNAYIESFNSRLRDECLSQHWFASLSHARSVVDAWRNDYNHHRQACLSFFKVSADSRGRCDPTIRLTPPAIRRGEHARLRP
jgi:hypothetical protein